MRALVNTAPGKLKLLDWPMPFPGPGQVRVKTMACGICSTDLLMINGWQRTRYPAIPGHEWSGVVEAVGDGVDPFLVGRPCVAENVLKDGGEVGFEHPGGYGEYLVTDADNIYLLPPDFPVEIGALIEPMAVCLHALHRLRLENKDSALIFGDGPVGLITLLLLRYVGLHEVVVVGGYPYRLNLAKTLGADHVFDYNCLGADQTARLRQVTGKTYSTILEASGSTLALQMAMGLASHGAKILVMGDYAESQAKFLWNDLLHNEFELIGSNASAGAWPEALTIFSTGILPLDRLVTHRFPIDRFMEGIELATSLKNTCLKVLLEWPQ
jgi:threonine dehydrogenase-like Zn-dependent dehydrogenase